MILKKTAPETFDKDKYYVDMNEIQNKSRSRLYYVFVHIAEKELGWTTKQFKEVREEFGRKIEFPSLIKAMDEYIGDYVVFYYGDGSDETTYLIDKIPNKGTPPKYRAKCKGKKRKSSQASFDENLRNHVAKDYGLKG